MSEKCNKCGNENFAVARNMIGTRICKCGNTWAPGEAQGEVKPREFFLVKKRIPTLISDFECMEITTDGASEEDKILLSLQIGKDERIHAVEYSAYQALQKENEALKARVGDLENSIRQVRNSIALGTWNVDERFAKFSIEVSKHFEKALKEGLDDSL